MSVPTLPIGDSLHIPCVSTARTTPNITCFISTGHQPAYAMLDRGVDRPRRRQYLGLRLQGPNKRLLSLLCLVPPYPRSVPDTTQHPGST
eukprot:713439-Rhodomonas_salina.1